MALLAVVAVAMVAAGVFLAAARYVPVAVSGRAIPAASGGQVGTSVAGADSAADSRADFSQIFTRVSSGVVPVTSVACGGGGGGSGFLIDPNTLLTAAHVVDGAVAVSAQVDGEPHHAEVIGFDDSADLAVLEIDQGAAGTALQIADSDPVAGDQVAALGYPLGAPLRLTEGRVLAVDRPASVEGSVRYDLLESDAAGWNGNSGGPLVDRNGNVVGVVIAGPTNGSRTFAVKASEVRSRMSAMPEPPTVTCEQPPLGPDDEAAAGLPGSTQLTDAVAETFAAYFSGINSGDYARAYDQLSPRLTRSDGFESFAEGVSTSYDFAFDVRDSDISSDSAFVWLEFVSLQDPDLGPDGESCTQWSLEYELVKSGDGRFLIDRVRGHEATSGHRPCD